MTQVTLVYFVYIVLYPVIWRTKKDVIKWWTGFNEKIGFEIILLVLMITVNKKYLIRFGMFGILLCIAVNSYALIHTQL